MLHDQGVPDITIQKILRHKKVETTREAYIKTLPKQVTNAMNGFAAALPDVVYKRDIASTGHDKATVQ